MATTAHQYTVGMTVYHKDTGLKGRILNKYLQRAGATVRFQVEWSDGSVTFHYAGDLRKLAPGQKNPITLPKSQRYS